LPLRLQWLEAWFETIVDLAETWSVFVAQVQTIGHEAVTLVNDEM
jgi:hypothetical protein